MQRRGISLFLAALLIVAGLATTAVAQPSNYTAHLTGEAEVPAVETRTVGQAVFQLNRDGTELRFRLIVANIQDVTMAHIHCAPEGENGAVTAWLYPDDGPPSAQIDGRFSGVLSTGVLTDAHITDGCGGVDDLADLVELIEDGGAYVNVHTVENPAGEIRGQIG